MTAKKGKTALAEIKDVLASDREFPRPPVQALVQEVLEAEMTAALGAAKGERKGGCLGYPAVISSW